MTHILVIVIFMKLGGPIVTMQEFASEHTCNDAATLIAKKIESIDIMCIKK